MAEVSAALLRLRLAEGRVQRAAALARSAATDPAKKTLLLATARDLPQVKDSFEADFLAVEAAAVNNEDFDVGTHAARVVNFDSDYYTVMAAVESLTAADTKSEEQEARKPSTSSRVALPKIQLPTFEGNVKEWMNFANLFQTLVAKNTGLTDVEKLVYLKSSLSGEPASMIQALPLSEANFSIAWNLLTNRYQNQRLIVAHHVDALLDAPSASTDSPFSLRRLLTVVTENLSALEALKVPVNHWDLILLPILLKRLDVGLRTQWELTIEENQLPTMVGFTQFLEKYCRTHEAVQSSRPKTKDCRGGAPQPRKFRTPPPPSNFMVQADPANCVMCGKGHSLQECRDFLLKPPRSRFEVVKMKKLCLKCLQGSHRARSCPSAERCKDCKGRHHSLLHFPEEERQAESEPPAPESEQHSRECSSVNVLSSFARNPHTIMLATAIIDVQDASGLFQPIRALFDSGSQANIISEGCVKRLGLSRQRIALSLQGLSQTPLSAARGVTVGVVKPRGEDQPRFSSEMLILTQITGPTPSAPLDPSMWHHIKDVQLADPTCARPGPIDMLIGAELFPQCLTGQRRLGPPGAPVALETIFGWILMGPVHSSTTALLEPTEMTNLFVTSGPTTPSLENLVERLWKLEELPALTLPPAPEDEACEEIFVTRYQRTAAGRYSVPLPFKTADPDLGESSSSALRRFHALERRLHRNPDIKEQYIAFMREYISAGHMSNIDSDPSTTQLHFIPHHWVQNPGSTTTKLRVVFDASAKTGSGLSLNDVLLTGPKLQRDIVEVLLRFRVPPVVFTADIKQMYRQILIHPEHRRYQNIYWRESPDQPVEVYQLNTVTYGVASAPYLALRTLHQLAVDEQATFPAAAAVLQTDTYVDDVVSGAGDLDSALKLRLELQQLLRCGGFELRKFSSNCSALLEDLPTEALQQSSESYSFDEDRWVKVLGLRWNPITDSFSYSWQLGQPVFTKRGILADVARIFDPLGWLSPLILVAKLIIQHLWLTNCHWDARPPHDVVAKWERIRAELHLCSQISIPRCMTCGDVLSKYELHGFCDSSEKGYAAVVYLRKWSQANVVTSHILLAKSKVAPLKKVSLPRLELCAAVLLARCLRLLLTSYAALNVEQVFAWTDSSVVLSWIRGSPHMWKTFVANRVTQIQECTAIHWWQHVPSSQNPADCASRGLTPSQLVEHPLWWTGPSWLCMSKEHWPQSTPVADTGAYEERRTVVLQTATELSPLLQLLEKRSSLKQAQRIVALCVRFGERARSQQHITGSVTTKEMAHALQLLVQATQRMDFPEVLSQLASGAQCHTSIQRLNPFLDADGIIRVGGRLQNSDLPFAGKHPILLAKSSRLAVMIVDHLHKELLHLGCNTLQSVLQREFWVLGARSLIRHRLHQCLKCFRARPKAVTPPMASLPASRVCQAKPFFHTGVDYGGPISITMVRTRKPKVLQAYICLFICFTTKAVHLELVSDLTSEAFLAALRRFVARRGQCAHIYSDCGTNFVGANRKLSQLQEFLRDPGTARSLEQGCTDMNISWHFNPPSAPHFGGLWEAGIKSVKSVLTKVVGSQLLSYEEFNTVLTQIESTLKSRPLCALSNDPSDHSALTPNHFLTLGPPQILPDEEVLDIPVNRLSRWALVQQLHQSFWKRWHLEYLQQLQPRQKWNRKEPNLEEGMLVLIRDPNLPPLRWRLGRVVTVYPGGDGVVRVAKVQTPQGSLTRPVVKLCPLPCT